MLRVTAGARGVASSCLATAQGRTRAIRSLATTAGDGRDWTKAPPLHIINGTVVNHDAMFKADVLIERGKITRVGNIASRDIPANVQVLDATGKMVIPGGIDTHVHLEMPFMGTFTCDDYHSGTQAAVAGGTTCLLDFVIPQRGQSLVAAYKIWEQRATPKINCDVGFHMAVTYCNDTMLEEMKDVTALGVNSFKFFLAYNNVLRMYDHELLRAFRRCKELGALPQVHAENGDMVDDGQADMVARGILGPEGHNMSRPEANEAEATKRALAMAQQVNVPLYVVHVMSRSALAEVARAKEAGQVVYGEPVAAALGTTGAEVYNKDWRHAAGHVMSPPLREDPATPAALMRGLISGALDVVGTDNATFNANQKALGKDDFRLIPNGVNGIEDRMSVVWHKGVKLLGMAPQDFVKVTSTKAAMLFSLNKGRVAEGWDADVVIWNPDATRIVSKHTHHHAVDFNIFEGMELAGVAETTVSAGRVVWADGRLCTENGWGRIIPRPTHGHAYLDQEQRDRLLDPCRRKVEREPYMGPVIA